MANKLVTVTQLDTAVDGFAAAVVAAGYEKKTNLGDLAYKDSVDSTEIAASLQETLDGKLTQTRAQELVDQNVGKAYRPGGNATLATLPAPSAAVEGMVYNMTEEFTTTALFIEGSGKTYTAGSEVAVIEVEENDETVYKYNVLSAYVATTNFVPINEFTPVQTKVNNIEIATAQDIQDVINGLNLEDTPAEP